MERGFSQFIVTSAMTGKGVDQLREAITQLIPWDLLPATSSPELWKKFASTCSSGARATTC